MPKVPAAEITCPLGVPFGDATNQLMNQVLAIPKDGDGVGEGEPLGDAVGEALGTPDGVGLGDADGDGDTNAVMKMVRFSVTQN